MVGLRVLAGLVLIAVVIVVIYVIGQAPQGGYISSRSTTFVTSSASTLASTTIAKTTTVNATAYASNSPLPTVMIISPKNLSTVNGVVNISANVIDSVKVRYVQFYLGENLSWTSNSMPYHYLWNTTSLTGSEYMITAKAFDYSNRSAQASIIVEIGLVQHGK
jgi:hypothetical protein